MSFSQNFILQSKLLAQYRRPVNTRLCGIVVPSSTQTPFRKYSYLPKRTAGFSRLSAPPRLNPGLGLDPSLSTSPGHTRSFSSTGQKHDKYTHSVTRIGPLSKKKKYEGLPCPIPQRPKGWPTSILSFNDYRYYKPILRSAEWDFAKVPSTVDGKRTESLVKFYAMDSDEDRLKFQTILKDLQEVEKVKKNTYIYTYICIHVIPRNMILSFLISTNVKSIPLFPLFHSFSYFP